MGTRADFYIRRESKPLEPSDWVGSIAWDGYPGGIPKTVLKAKTTAAFRRALRELQQRDDWTSPKEGWPWPWETSATTDYVYVFSNGKVSYRETKYPDMSGIKSVTFGPRSGLIMVTER